jgi:hypothetical protein
MYPALEINLPSTTFALLNHGVALRLDTRFGASMGGTNLLPEGQERSWHSGNKARR